MSSTRVARPRTGVPDQCRCVPPCRPPPVPDDHPPSPPASPHLPKQVLNPKKVELQSVIEAAVEIAGLLAADRRLQVGAGFGM